MEIPISHIEPPKYLMRTVEVMSDDFLRMRDSIKRNGILQSLLVRKKGDIYELIDGNYRYTCAKQLRMKTVPCNVVEVDDNEFLILQLQANLHRPKTTTKEFATQVKLILKRNPKLSLREMASMVSKSTSWIRELLYLRNLSPEVIDELGDAPIKHLSLLAKLPPSRHLECIEKYKNMPFKTFKEYVYSERKKLKEALTGSAKEDYNRLELPTVVRDPKKIESELENSRTAVSLLNEDDTPEEAWKKALEWVLMRDEVSFQRRAAKFRATCNKREKKLKRKNERSNKN